MSCRRSWPGIVYCNTIAFCRDAYELRRAREWTEALTRWCEQQPDMVAHKGICLVHRAEIMTLGGAWREALEEARRVAEQFTQGVLNERALGHAAYRQAEVHRLQGRFDEAEAAYREASRLGREPQPGLALMRLAQGKRDAAAGAIRRAVSETALPLRRAALLPAYVEILVATGDVAEARAACDELDAIARRQGSEALIGLAAHAEGEVALAEGDARSALASARHAWQTWQELGAPYDAARARVLVARACAELGDADTAALELDAARHAFFRLGAAPDVARLDALGRRRRRGDHGLTAREVEVLRPDRARQEQPGDRELARDQRADRRPARAEHLRQAGRLVACLGERLRSRARSPLSLAWNDHAARAGKLVRPPDDVGAHPP